MKTKWSRFWRTFFLVVQRVAMFAAIISCGCAVWGALQLGGVV
jgi:hypothetical protein